jgi:hypothetical protein
MRPNAQKGSEPDVRLSPSLLPLRRKTGLRRNTEKIASCNVPPFVILAAAPKHLREDGIEADESLTIL